MVPGETHHDGRGRVPGVDGDEERVRVAVEAARIVDPGCFRPPAVRAWGVLPAQPDAKLPGAPPPAPPWGQVRALRSPETTRRVQPDPRLAGRVALVLGAGGSLGPDVVHTLQARGYGLVVGADRQLTYVVDGAVYRELDLRSAEAVVGLVEALRGCGLELGPVIDLAAVQTNPRDGERGGLGVGREALASALPGGVWVYMSTAEVYGAPRGAPYAEDHEQAPINPYGRCKQAEEVAALAAHGRDGLRVTALRSWTIAMVDHDADGRVVSTRNYNDPLIALAEQLARAGVKVPVVEPDAACQFHLAEEVAQVLVWLAEQPEDADVWGRAWNCPGVATTHGRLAELCFEVFSEAEGAAPWWGPLARLAFARGLRRGPLEWLAGVLESTGAGGARELGSRLPFLYRSTDMDAAALCARMADVLPSAGGSSSEDAARRLCLGILRGGPDQLSLRRYRSY